MEFSELLEHLRDLGDLAASEGFDHFAVRLRLIADNTAAAGAPLNARRAVGADVKPDAQLVAEIITAENTRTFGAQR